MKYKSTLLKIRKNETSYILITPGGKKNYAKTFYFLKKFEESVVKILGKSQLLGR